MRESEMDRILMAYELGSGRKRCYRGDLMDRFDDDDLFQMTERDRLRNLIALYEYLGAYRLVEHLRYRRR